VVLCGGDKFFSIGLDLPALLKLNRVQMSRFWTRFDDAVWCLYSLPMPAAAAIGGHATAGGTILALTADVRYVAEGRRLMGLNEVSIGVPVPFLADLLLRQVIGERAAAKITLAGELMPPEDARRIGLVDDVLPAERVERHALEKTSSLAGKPQPAFGITKNNRLLAVRSLFTRQREERQTELLDCWFDPAVQRMLAEAAEKF
jgi:enoyl-CoA hydratase/carnithine racemase